MPFSCIIEVASLYCGTTSEVSFSVITASRQFFVPSPYMRVEMLGPLHRCSHIRVLNTADANRWTQLAACSAPLLQEQNIA